MPTTMRTQSNHSRNARILPILLLSLVLSATFASGNAPTQSFNSLGLVCLDGAEVVNVQRGSRQVPYILLPLKNVNTSTSEQEDLMSSATIREISQRNALINVRESPITTRVVATLAAAPICLSLIAHVLLMAGRHWNAWCVLSGGLVLVITAKLVAIPAGILMLILGLVIADLEVSLVGISSLALIYAAQVGSWGGAIRLANLLRWAPDMISMQRWHVKGPNEPCNVGKDDPYKRGRQTAAKLILRAGDEAWSSTLQWTDEIVIALLASKFVCLTQNELNWTRGPENPTIEELTTKLTRWTKGWNGQPGIWAREWVAFQANGPSSEPVETTLRLVIVLYECIMRSEFTGCAHTRKQKELLMRVLNQPRNGDMGWVYSLVRDCLNKDGIERSEVGAP